MKTKTQKAPEVPQPFRFLQFFPPKNLHISQCRARCPALSIKVFNHPFTLLFRRTITLFASSATGKRRQQQCRAQLVHPLPAHERFVIQDPRGGSMLQELLSRSYKDEKIILALQPAPHPPHVRPVRLAEMRLQDAFFEQDLKACEVENAQQARLAGAGQRRGLLCRSCLRQYWNASSWTSRSISETRICRRSCTSATARL